MKNICTVIAISIIAVTFSGCDRRKPVFNPQDVSVPPSFNDGSQPSPEVVKNAILTACVMKGWSAKVARPGVIEADITVRIHQASIEIPFTASNYSIIYKDSQGLKHKNGKIHRNYNNWVTGLSRSIQQQIFLRSQRTQPEVKLL